MAQGSPTGATAWLPARTLDEGIWLYCRILWMKTVSLHSVLSNGTPQPKALLGAFHMPGYGVAARTSRATGHPGRTVRPLARAAVLCAFSTIGLDGTNSLPTGRVRAIIGHRKNLTSTNRTFGLSVHRFNQIFSIPMRQTPAFPLLSRGASRFPYATNPNQRLGYCPLIRSSALSNWLGWHLIRPAYPPKPANNRSTCPDTCGMQPSRKRPMANFPGVNCPSRECREPGGCGRSSWSQG